MLRYALVALAAALALILSACGQAVPQAPASQTPADSSAGGPIRVVASTSIIGDVVGQVGGEQVAVTTLVPVGGDAHSFAPSPQDIARVAEAQIVFVNGAGYEEFLARLLESAGGAAELVELSEGIALRELGEGEEHGHEGEEHAEGEEHGHGALDPHTWTDPANVKYWTAAIAEALGRADAANAGLYQERAATYNAELDELDVWIGEQFAQVPEERRLLVTDHAVFGYMADRYGLTQVGALLPGFSSSAAPSAQDLAALQEEIRELGVQAIFVGDVVNENLARQIADDTGTRVVTILTESLTPPDGEGPTYIAYMRHNVTTMVEALR